MSNHQENIFPFVVEGEAGRGTGLDDGAEARDHGGRATPYQLSYMNISG